MIENAFLEFSHWYIEWYNVAEVSLISQYNWGMRGRHSETFYVHKRASSKENLNGYDYDREGLLGRPIHLSEDSASYIYL